MNLKSINPNELHFMASSRFDRSKPEDFGLKKVDETEHYADKHGDIWKNEILWDSGWGNEYGFVKLPEPDFNQLWILITESNIKNNKLGAAELLNYYPNELKNKLQVLFNANEKIDQDLTSRLSHLDILNHVMNHSETKGKKPADVNADYQEWKKLKDDYDKLKTVVNNRQNSFWQRAKKRFNL